MAGRFARPFFASVLGRACAGSLRLGLGALSLSFLDRLHVDFFTPKRRCMRPAGAFPKPHIRCPCGVQTFAGPSPLICTLPDISPARAAKITKLRVWATMSLAYRKCCHVPPTFETKSAHAWESPP